MKTLITLASGLLLFFSASAQTPLTLDSCYAQALRHYPLLRQQGLIAQGQHFALDNLSKNLWPQLSLNGQATYQSDVTSIPISFPGIDIKTPTKDQYKVYAELSQSLTDWLPYSDQKALQNANSGLQQANLDAELFKLRDRVNQLYFNILLSDERLLQNEISQKDIDAGIARVQSSIQNGTDYKASLDKLQAELLKNRQRSIELQAQRQAYCNMLCLLSGRPAGEKLALVAPATPLPSSVNNRPELRAFALKDQSLLLQSRLLDQRLLPKASVFIQAGAGQPSPVNLISRSWDSYYIAGLRFNWTLNNYVTIKNERQQLSIERQLNAAQRETFQFNTEYAALQQNDEVEKLRKLLEADEEMVALRTSVKNTAKVQLDNGIITVSDYIREVDAEDLARQDRALHLMQLLLAQYNYQNSFGN